MQRICAIIAIIAVFASEAAEAAQPDVGWAAVQGIRPGETVRVHVPGHKYKGTLIGVSDDTVRVNTGAGEISSSRPEVTRVYVQTPSHRLRNTLVGAAAGTAIAIALYLTFGALFRNEGGDNTVGQFIVAPIGLATGIGAVAPTGTMQKIFDRDHPQSVR